MNPIEPAQHLAEESVASREAMDRDNAGTLLGDEYVVGIAAESGALCFPCARETLGDAKVDWFLAQPTYDVTDEQSQTFRAIEWEPMEALIDCDRCGRPLKPGEPADRGAPVGVMQWSDSHHVYCAEHAAALIGSDRAAQVLAPDYAGLAHVRGEHGEDVLIEFASGGETWKLSCEVCGERLTPEPEDDDED